GQTLGGARRIACVSTHDLLLHPKQLIHAALFLFPFGAALFLFPFGHCWPPLSAILFISSSLQERKCLVLEWLRKQANNACFCCLIQPAVLPDLGGQELGHLFSGCCIPYGNKKVHSPCGRFQPVVVVLQVHA